MAHQRGFRGLQSDDTNPQGGGAGGVAEFLASLTLSTAMARMREARWVDLLQWYRLCRCTLERDRYCALLSIATDLDVAAHPELAPDYTTADAELELKIGKFLIQQQPDGRETLMRAGLVTQTQTSTDTDKDRPSWMQSFAQFRLDCDAHSEQTSMHNASMAAGPDSVFVARSVPDWPDVICVQGYKADDLLGVARQTDHKMKHEERVCDYICSAFEMFSARVTALKLPNVVDRECIEAMVTTMAADTWIPSHTRDMGVLVLGLFVVLVSRKGQFDGFPGWKTVLAGILQSAYGHDKVLTADGRIAVSDEVTMHAFKSFFSHAFSPCIFGIKAAITREGSFANVPPLSEPMDEIWIVSGCRLPVVLRKSARREGMFRLVGVCYAHGVMDGSLLLREDFAFRDVLIC
ncbi:uncharacterized protein B0I36DRAFT_331065 [Microdochium trichocladiopsis]|uniref:Uncharacterized protein n=1 Tax=Microdochium trichocladiopsis TaxID=1682393 RepID=A0A9P9BMU5_9PEZI|nr:uncharacterized protein B0I36DRAFT_331065 [Microdochium trichocladiopsis]KAH7026635.1 hypothetical protein B0I36DRAFT_331065 [Microdochium trichocladiopsis]